MPLQTHKTTHIPSPSPLFFFAPHTHLKTRASTSDPYAALASHSLEGTCVVTVDIVRPNHSYLARSTVRRSIQNKEAYCKKWGYSFHVLHDEVLPVDATATKTLCLYKVQLLCTEEKGECRWGVCTFACISNDGAINAVHLLLKLSVSKICVVGSYNRRSVCSPK